MVFELLLLFIGFIISIVTLFTKKLESKNTVKKILAGLYIVVCVVSTIVLFSKSSNDKEGRLILFHELSNINNSVRLQSDTLQLILTETVILNHSLDSLNRITKNIIEQREKSQKIYQEQNKILERSNELTYKRIYGERPEVVVYNSEIEFIPKDSISSGISIKFRNIGKRTASKFWSRTYFAFKNKVGIYTFLIDFPGQQSMNDIFINSGSSAEEQIGVTWGFEQIKNQTSGGTIIIKYKYYDEILNNTEQKETRFEFNNDWSIKNKIFNENSLQEKGLDIFLKKNIKNQLN